jgi:hypothetical protein
VERGIAIRSVQLLLGHESLETTMIYTHVARQGVAGVTSPLDLLSDLEPADVEAAAAATRGLQDGGVGRLAPSTEVARGAGTGARKVAGTSRSQSTPPATNLLRS